MGETALSARDIHARYPGTERNEPLRGVSLTVDAGELVAVLGANGAGKSTLLRVLSGTLAPTKGDVRLFGAPLEGMDRRSIARAIAVVPQASPVAWGLRVREVVAMGRAPHQGAWMQTSDEDARVIDDAIAKCDLTELASRVVSELSGGEQRRVAIARALAQRPKVLLLDEPAAYLDVRHQVALYDLLWEQVEREKIACLVVMHDLNVAAQYASRVVLAKEGALVAQGRVDEVMTYARLRETFGADLYCGVNDLTGTRFFLPMRGR